MNRFKDQQNIIQEYNEMMKKSQNIAIYTRDIEMQKEEVSKLEEFIDYLIERKIEYIKEKNEMAADLLLCLQLGAKAVSCELSMIIALKEDNPSVAWDNLIEAQNITDSVIQNHPIKGEQLLGYKGRLMSYETLLFPKMIFTSIGGIISSSECSICNESYEKCNHVKGRFYMGEMCVRVIKEIDMEELSIVENPADKRCRPISIPNELGEQLDVFTLMRK